MAFRPPPVSFLHEGNRFRFPCYCADQFGIYGHHQDHCYIITDGIQNQLLSSVSRDGNQRPNALLVIFEGIPLADLLQQLQPLEEPTTTGWNHPVFFNRNFISHLQHLEFRRHSNERRMIAKVLVDKVIRSLVNGQFFGDLDPKTILVSLKRNNDVLGEKMICSIEIPKVTSIYPPLDPIVQQTRELQQLSSIVFGDILPGIFTHDHLSLQNLLSDFEVVKANLQFVLDHPALWTSEKRNRFLETFYKDLETKLAASSDYTLVINNAIQDFYNIHQIPLTWHDLLLQFPMNSPVGSVLLHPNGQDTYVNGSARDLYRFIRNFIVHSCPHRFSAMTDYSSKEFVDILLSSVFPGLLCCTFRWCLTVGLEPNVPDV